MSVYGLVPLRDWWIGRGGTWGDWLTPAIASSVILLLTVLHCRGQTSSAWLQNTTTAIKFALLAGFVIAGAALGAGDWGHFREGRGLSEQSLPVAAPAAAVAPAGPSAPATIGP